MNKNNPHIEESGASTSAPHNVISAKYIFLSLGLSALSIAIVVYFTWQPGILDQLQVKRLPGLLIALVVSLLRIWFSAAKIRFLSDQKISRLGALRTTLVWDFTSAVSPSSVGGAPMATYAMTREGLSLGKSTALTLYGVLLDQIMFAILIPALMIAGIYYDIVPENVGMVGEGIMIVMYVTLLGYALLLAYSVFRNPALLRIAVTKIFSLPLLRKYKSSVEKEALNLEKSAIELRSKSFSFILKAFTISTLSWLSRIWIPVIVILSFGHSDVVLSFLRSLSLNLAGFFVPTPGGSGGMEGLFALFMGTIMARPAYMALAIFMWRFISYYISIGFGMWATMWYIRKQVEQFNSKQEEKVVQ